MPDSPDPQRHLQPEDLLIEQLLEARGGQRREVAYEFGPFRLEPAEHRLLRNGAPVPLAPREFEALRLLVARHGHLVTKATLLETVWRGTFVGDNTIAQRMSVLRRALGEAPAGRFIETVPKRGYRFVAPVREV
jgi:DNA-binding winged helix-turn-helix (wHTH) protein